LAQAEAFARDNCQRGSLDRRVPHHIRRATPLIAVDFEILALSDATTRLRALPLLQSLDNSPSLGNFRSMDERVERREIVAGDAPQRQREAF
jgi:hypothetical protein